MAWIRQKSTAATFPLWSLRKQNSWVKIGENNMKDTVEVSLIAY